MSLSANKYVKEAVEVQGVAKDEKLNAMMEMSKMATRTFLDALPEMTDRMSFKAFTVKKFDEDEDGAKMNSFMDILQTSIIVHMGELDPDCVQRYNFDTSIESDNEYSVLWIHARGKHEKYHSEEVTLL
jgi:hypothetical protein